MTTGQLRDYSPVALRALESQPQQIKRPVELSVVLNSALLLAVIASHAVIAINNARWVRATQRALNKEKRLVYSTGASFFQTGNLATNRLRN